MDRMSYKTEKDSCNRPAAFHLPHISDFIWPIIEVAKMCLRDVPVEDSHSRDMVPQHHDYTCKE